MKPFPLQLEEFRVAKFAIEGQAIPEGTSPGWRIGTAYSLRQEEERHWLLLFEMSLDDSEDGRLALYKIEAKLAGRFQWKGPLPEDRDAYARIIGSNGLSILYGTLREMIAQVTLRGLNDLFSLPIVSFVDFDPAAVEYFEDKSLAAPGSPQSAPKERESTSTSPGDE